MEIVITRDTLIAMRTRGEGIEKDGQYWTEEDRNLLIEGHADGMGISELAILLSRSESAVIQQMYRERLMVTPETKKRNRKPKPELPSCEICELKDECVKLREKCPRLKAYLEEE